MRTGLILCLMFSIPWVAPATSSDSYIRQSLIQQAKKSCPSCQFEITKLSIPKKLGKASKLQFFWPRRPLKGHFRLRALDPRHPSTSHSIIGYLQVKAHLPIARDYLPSGSILTANDVRWELEDVTRSWSPVLTQNKVHGLKTLRTLRAGQKIRSSYLRQIPLVQRNQRVTVVSKRGPITISTQATALQSGSLGDLIRLRNPIGGSVFQGLITGRGKVDVH